MNGVEMTMGTKFDCIIMILLKGLCRNELKKIKSVVQYAVFAAYHLFLETSFLAEEGATLPKVTLNSSFSVPEKTNMHNSVVSGPNHLDYIQPQQLIDVAEVPGESPHHCKDAGELLSSAEHLHSVHIPVSIEDKTDGVISDRCLDVSTCGATVDCSSFTNDGYKKTIRKAYGQTSSGKTFTMNGSENDPGIIQRAVRDVFDRIYKTESREFLIRVSYIEIYNEEINDLLVINSHKLPMHECLERGFFVAGLRKEIVSDAYQVLKILEAGEVNRHFGETNMNVRSSRSHTIFRMVIEQRERH